jgi:hypothetical protein
MYMALHPCGACGDEKFARTVRMIVDGDALITRYTGPCRTCHAGRDFRFRIDDEFADAETADAESADGGRTPPLTAGEPEFGRAGASEIIDAGQWLQCADRIIAATPSAILGVPEDEWRRRRYMFKAAAESVGEVLKFIPAGSDDVPPDSFWTDDGRDLRDRVPGRFRRDKLEHLRLACLDLAARFAG